MKPKPEAKTEKVLDGATAALLRAAQRAREIARRTGTPLVLGKDGRVEKRWLGDETTALQEEPGPLRTNASGKIHSKRPEGPT